MQTTVQTTPKTRSALQTMKPHPVTPDALDLLDQFGITVTVQRGNEIYGQSEPTESCWRIVSGCVRTEKYLEDGRRQVGAFLWPGDLVGMDDLGMHDFGAQAITDVTLRRYPRRMVEALAQSHAALAHRLRALAVGNLRNAYQQMTLLGRRTATERIASFLLDMHRRSISIDSRIVGVPMNRMDIADYLGLTIETICRYLAQLQRDGIVVILRSGFELRNPDALLGLANKL